MARFTLLAAGALLAVVNAPLAHAQQPPQISLDTAKQQYSYAIGLDIGENLQQIQPDMNALMAGIMDAVAEREPRLNAEQIQQAIAALQQELQQRQAQEAAQMTAQASEFLAQNKQRPGVTETATGLQYEVLQQGTGPKPTKNDVVTVHYRGTLLDGTEFDSSYQRGEPTSFPVGAVIAGWTEALQLMPVGSKYKLFIPSDLAYGQRGAPPRIGPNSMLIFEVELLGVQPPEEAPSPGR